MSNTLKFNNGKFTIMTLGDLHENLAIDTPLKQKKRNDMHRLVEAGIRVHRPDLIVLLGDTLNERDDSADFSAYKEALRDILKPILDSGIPFCYVLGNHEHDQGQEKQIVDAYSQFETMVGENDTTAPRGNFNCNILVKNSAGTEDILNLWFIDSNNCCDDKSISNYDWVHEDQIAWYENKAREIKDTHNGKTIPAILFQHTPVYEENYIMREAKFYERPFAAKGSYPPFDKYYICLLYTSPSPRD